MRRLGISAVLISLVLLSSVGNARAQAVDPEGPRISSSVVDVTRGVVLDPTTYAPAAILYQSMRLDWRSSQPFFQHGYVEANDRYTVSGRAHDVPVSFAQGNRKILTDSLLNLPASFANNTTSRVVERMLTQRFPNHPKIIRALGWIERTSFASYMSYRLSAKHFRQWQMNTQLAQQLGY